MKSIDEADAQERFVEIINDAQRQPILIRRDDREIAVVVSAAEYERLRMTAVSEFLALRDDVAREANAAGLTEERLSELLNDD